MWGNRRCCGAAWDAGCRDSCPAAACCRPPAAAAHQLGALHWGLLLGVDRCTACHRADAKSAGRGEGRPGRRHRREAQDAGPYPGGGPALQGSHDRGAGHGWRNSDNAKWMPEGQTRPRTRSTAVHVYCENAQIVGLPRWPSKTPLHFPRTASRRSHRHEAWQRHHQQLLVCHPPTVGTLGAPWPARRTSGGPPQGYDVGACGSCCCTAPPPPADAARRRHHPPPPSACMCGCAR